MIQIVSSRFILTIYDFDTRRKIITSAAGSVKKIGIPSLNSLVNAAFTEEDGGLGGSIERPYAGELEEFAKAMVVGGLLLPRGGLWPVVNRPSG